MEEIIFKPIGFIESEYDDVKQMPKSTSESSDKTAKLIVNPEYMEAMCDIKNNQEYMILFYFHKSEGYDLKVRLRGDGPITGLFSTHAPRRPNAIGVSNIKIKEVKDNIIEFYGVDMLNNTPVLDIKKVF